MCLVNYTIQPLVRCATRAGQAQRTTSQSGALALVKTVSVFTHIHGQRSYLDGFGLHYYVARWYDPATAHFAQADTIIPNSGNSGDWDRYAYVLFNPFKYIDPSGYWGFSPLDPTNIPPVIIDFAWGYLYELASITSGGVFDVNNPYRAKPYESIPSYAGRLTADFLAAQAGILMVDVGIPLIGGGVTACVGSEGVLCPAGVGMVTAGAALAAAGVYVVGVSGVGAVEAGAGLIQQAQGGISHGSSNGGEPRFFDPSPEHDEIIGWGSPIDLPNDIAQQVLDNGIIDGNQIWGIYDDQVYVFQSHRPNTWHGYNVTGVEKPPKAIMNQWRNNGDITNAYYNKMRKWPERGH